MAWLLVETLGSIEILCYLLMHFLQYYEYKINIISQWLLVLIVDDFSPKRSGSFI